MGLMTALGIGSAVAGGLLNRNKGKKTSESGSSQSTATQNTTFDPTGLSTYQGLQPQVGSTLSDFMSNPWESGWFQQALNRSSEGTGARTQAQIQNLFNPAMGLAGASGGGVDAGYLSNPNAFMADQLGRISRGASRERANTLSNLLLGSAGLRMNAANTAAGYRPLATGQTGTESRAYSGSTQAGQGGSLLGDLFGLGGNILLGGINRDNTNPGYAGGIMAGFPDTGFLPPITAPRFTPPNWDPYGHLR